MGALKNAWLFSPCRQGAEVWRNLCLPSPNTNLLTCHKFTASAGISEGKHLCVINWALSPRAQISLVLLLVNLWSRTNFHKKKSPLGKMQPLIWGRPTGSWIKHWQWAAKFTALWMNICLFLAHSTGKLPLREFLHSNAAGREKNIRKLYFLIFSMNGTLN